MSRSEVIRKREHWRELSCTECGNVFWAARDVDRCRYCYSAFLAREARGRPQAKLETRTIVGATAPAERPGR